MTSDLSRLRSDVLKQWSASAWDALIETLQARLAPLEEQLGVQRAVTDAIVGRGLAVIEAELAPLVAQGTDVLGDINTVKADAEAAYTALRAMVNAGIPMANIIGLATALAGRAPLESPDLTGIPTAPTPPAGTNTTQIANTAFVRTAITALINSAPGTLDTLKELAAALGDDANFAATVSAALAQRLRVDAAQGLTDAQKGQARANIGASALDGYRNKIINGNFEVWQRGTSQTADGYGSDDRWTNGHVGSTKTHSRQAFTPGQTAVPGNPAYYSRTVVSSVAGAGNLVVKSQRIGGVAALSGATVTLTFWAKCDAARPISIDCTQNFGTGGSPSAGVVGIGARKLLLSTSWQRFSYVIQLPSVSGKAFGSNGDDYLGVIFWFDAGSNYSARTSSLSQQSGTFDLARISLVEGDATAEYDPCPNEDFTVTLTRCQRYYRTAQWIYSGIATTALQDLYSVVNIMPPMARAPAFIRSDAGYVNCTSPNAPAATSAYFFDFVRSSGAGTVYGSYTAILDAEI